MKKPCRKSKKLHKRLNNGGMSLVEVIIAITILGLVVVPVCQALTTAMVYNAKARTRQEMTLTAESIMETFKGYDIEDLKQMFSTGSGLSGLTCEGYTYAESIGADELIDVANFGITNLKDKSGNVYNVTITADNPTKKSVFEIKNMDAKRDAVFNGDRTWDTSIMTEVQNDLANYQSQLQTYFTSQVTDEDGNAVSGAMYMTSDGRGAVIADNIDKILASDAYDGPISNYIKLYQRHLVFEITEETDGVYTVTASMEYTYYVEDYPFYAPREPESVSDAYEEGETETSSEEEENIPGNLCHVKHFPLAEDGSYAYLTYTVALDVNPIYSYSKAAKLNRLFVYYYPQYELDTGNDIIEVKNTAGITNFECYIIKQVAQDMSVNKVAVSENSYQGVVEVTNSANGFAVYHNFDTNIGGGSSHTAPQISGIVAQSGSYVNTAVGSPFIEKEVLAYHVTVNITDADTGNTVAQLESTMNEKIKNKEGVVD